jgi:ABC-2 type transport system permease protein
MGTCGLLFFPKLRSTINAWRTFSLGWALVLLAVTLIFWLATYAVFHRMLVYFRSVEDIGVLLTIKLVYMALISFLLILVVSNLICAFNTFFFSDDLYLLVSSPVSIHRIYLARFAETLFHASWMVFLMAVPIFAALGEVFQANWLFYLSLPAVMLPLAMIPAACGIILAMLLVNIFMARRTRDLLSFLTVIILGGIVVTFRFLNPEKLLLKSQMKSLASFFYLLRSPDSLFSPHFWVGQVIQDTLGLKKTDSLFFLLLLYAAALGLFSLGYYFAIFLYRRGFSRAQEAETRKISVNSFWEGLLGLYLKPLSPAGRQLVLKDLKAFARDKGQWSQLLLLAGMIVVYLYNFSVLPLNKSPIPRFYLEIMVTFLNLGLAGFVIASISTRFVFPGVSMEGRCFWLLRSAPISMKRFLWAKMFVLTLPLLILGQFLVYVSSRILDTDTSTTVLACLVVFTLTFAIVGLGMGMGAIFPRFEVENPAHIPTGLGGILYMIASLGLIGATLLLLARPVHILLLSRIRETPLKSDQWVQIGIFFTVIVLVHYLVMRIAMARGSSALETLEL